MQTYSVLMSGESTTWWEGLSHAFGHNSSFQVVAIVEPAQTMVTAHDLQPDILIWRPDLTRPDLSIRELKNQCPFIVPIAVVKDPSHLKLLQLIEDGIGGCLPLRLRPRQIVAAVDLMIEGGLLCLPRISTESLRGQLNIFRYNGFDMQKRLTNREREVFLLLADNYSNQEIAQRLDLAESTVKSHLHNIFRKLGVHNRSEALFQVNR